MHCQSVRSKCSSLKLSGFTLIGRAGTQNVALAGSFTQTPGVFILALQTTPFPQIAKPCAARFFTLSLQHTSGDPAGAGADPAGAGADPAGAWAGSIVVTRPVTTFIAVLCWAQRESATGSCRTGARRCS